MPEARLRSCLRKRKQNDGVFLADMVVNGKFLFLFKCRSGQIIASQGM